MQPSQVSIHTPPNGIRAVFNQIAEAEDVISFALGEPDFPTAEPIIQMACETLRQGRTHYTPNAGLYELRAAIANRYGGRYKPEQVVVTAGATEGILLTLLSLINPGDEIILAEPYWPTYLGQINSCGAVPRFVRTYEEDGFSLRPENIEKAITSRTRLIIVNSPSNPTGNVIPGQTLEEIARLAQKHDLIVLSDEVYEHILYEGAYESITRLPGMEDRCILVNSFSKAYAMTGWRVGYVIAPEPIAAVMTDMHEYSVSCLSAFAQTAAVKALEAGQPYVQAMVDEFHVRRDMVVEGIRAIPGLHCIQPGGAFYLYFNISGTGLTSRDFVYRLLEQEKVALAPGSAFGQGQENYVRLSYANSRENIQEGLRRMARFVSRL